MGVVVVKLLELSCTVIAHEERRSKPFKHEKDL